MLLSNSTDNFSFKAKLHYSLYRNWQRRFARHLKWIRLKTDGLEKIKGQGPALLAPNHTNWKDIPLLGGLIERPIRFAADIRLFDEKLLYDFLRHKLCARLKYPFIKQAVDRMCSAFAKLLVSRIQWLGPFPAKIGENNLLLVDMAKQFLQNGDLVCIFPEGTLGLPNKLHRFKLGAAKILWDYYYQFKQSIPAFPIGISGTEKIYCPGMSVGVQVGSPLYIEDCAEINERQTLLKFAAELRKAVQQCLKSLSGDGK